MEHLAQVLTITTPIATTVIIALVSVLLWRFRTIDTKVDKLDKHITDVERVQNNVRVDMARMCERQGNSVKAIDRLEQHVLNGNYKQHKDGE